MSHCHDEHAGHGHDDHDHEHDHSDDITPALQASLYEQINFDEITTLNESRRDAGKAVVKKTWAERLDTEPELESDADEQLLMTVPFTAQVKLHSILLRTSPAACAPRTLHLYVNRADLDFASAEDLEPVQKLELSQTSEVQEIPVKRALFGKVQRLGLFFVDNFGGGDEEASRLSYIGFKGEWTRLGRAPANILYEAAPQPGDHKVKGASNTRPSIELHHHPKISRSRSCPSSIAANTPHTAAAMPPRLPIRVALPRPSAILPHEGPRRLLLPLIPQRGVKYGWSTAPPRSKHRRFNQPNSGLPALTTGPAAALKRRENTTPLRAGVLATKKGMTSLFVGKARVPCTVLQLDQVQVVAHKTREKHGYWAVQVGAGARPARNVTSPMLGYYEAKGVAPKSELAEFMVRGEEGLLPVGAQLLPDWFQLGQYVDVRARSRGMGFAGGMKRHGFKGQGASHGNSKNHRTIGTTGPSQGSGSRVFPGKKMPGRMGNDWVTVQNLKVLKVDNELGVVLVSGAVPGPTGRTVKLQDSKKRKAPALPHRQKALEELTERHPNAEEQLQAARERHLEMKEQRQARAADL
ncbi:60S ribosomal protein L3 [Tolypocladium paradoxum]|uniref:Large ribosomal subunit protein uL3m n=1 Tax=Tolypocladium paradoxum TaxID=94208 RepID=A0A2S4L6K4_9HYPO|nr:60S ribosomal protein L3 [Tolypocladium paradoxum]